MEGEDLKGSAEKGRAQIAWTRRSMPLSAAAMAELTPENACHIGMGLPIDPASSSLALWLLDAGFEVSVLNSHPSDSSADLLAVLESSGAAVVEDCDVFVTRQIDILLDTDGSLSARMSARLKGATVLSEIAAETVQPLPMSIIDLTGSDCRRNSAAASHVNHRSYRL